MECFHLSKKRGILNLLSLLLCFFFANALSCRVCFTLTLFFYQWEYMKRCLEMCIENKHFPVACFYAVVFITCILFNFCSFSSFSFMLFLNPFAVGAFSSIPCLPFSSKATSFYLTLFVFFETSLFYCGSTVFTRREQRWRSNSSHRSKCTTKKKRGRNSERKIVNKEDVILIAFNCFCQPKRDKKYVDF